MEKLDTHYSNAMPCRRQLQGQPQSGPAKPQSRFVWQIQRVSLSPALPFSQQSPLQIHCHKSTSAQTLRAEKLHSFQSLCIPARADHTVIIRSLRTRHGTQHHLARQVITQPQLPPMRTIQTQVIMCNNKRSRELTPPPRARTDYQNLPKLFLNWKPCR